MPSSSGFKSLTSVLAFLCERDRWTILPVDHLSIADIGRWRYPSITPINLADIANFLRLRL